MTSDSSSTFTLSVPSGFDVHTPPCFVQKVQPQLASGDAAQLKSIPRPQRSMIVIDNMVSVYYADAQGVMAAPDLHQFEASETELVGLQQEYADHLVFSEEGRRLMGEFKALSQQWLDGVKRDMPVATAGGIVGRVISVGPNFAMVQVITDKHAGVGAMLQASRAMGEIRGLDNDRCELKNVSTSEKVDVGESVVTTGLDRIYPKGLLVGTVERIEVDPNAPWHKIVVKPAAPVDRVEHVLVFLVEPKDLKIEGVK